MGKTCPRVRWHHNKINLPFPGIFYDLLEGYTGEKNRYHHHVFARTMTHKLLEFLNGPSPRRLQDFIRRPGVNLSSL